MRNDRKRGAQRIVLGLAILGGAIWLWEGVVCDRVFPKRWGCVEQGQIYRSGQLSAALVERTLRDNGVKVIVSLTGEEPRNKDQMAERAAAQKLGIELLRFPLRGNGTGDIEQYAQAIAAIVQARREARPVLVHCAAGTQRTGGVVACYRLLVEGSSMETVLAELKRYGWRPNDNPNLLPYINQHMAHLADRLKALGVIEQIPDPLPLFDIGDAAFVRDAADAKSEEIVVQ